MSDRVRPTLSGDLGARFGAAKLTVFERGWLSSNNVLFGDGDSVPAVLVDSGYWTHQQQTAALLRQALGPRGRLSRIVNTHLHSDHCGGNAHLQQLHGCEVDVPSGEFGKVESWSEDVLTYQATGQHCPRFVCHGRLRAGDRYVLAGNTWEVLASPGHDPESVMLHQPSLGILISADALWEDGFGVVFPELEGFGAFDDVRRTLDVISRLNVDIVIPGHGRPFVGLHAAIDRANARLDRFVADPRKHALHAAKVLIKFHLLEVQATTLTELDSWLASTDYFGAIFKRYFSSRSWGDWRQELLVGLRASGAIGFEGDLIRNL